MTCPRRGGSLFPLAPLLPNFSRHLPSPCPPPAAVVCRRGTLAAAGGGFFCFFKRGTMWPSPPFASPRGTFLPGGAMRKFWRGGGSCRSFFPPSAHPLPPPAAVVFRRGAPAAAGGGSFIFSKGGRCGHRPPFASPRGIFLPGGAMRKFWRAGGSSRPLPLLWCSEEVPSPQGGALLALSGHAESPEADAPGLLSYAR